MKKLLAGLLLTGSCLNSFSQEKGKFEFGFNIGLNGATVTSGTMTNSSYRSGLAVGAVGDYFFSDRWSIKAKLTYDQKGWSNGFFQTTDGGMTFDFYKTDYHLDYLTIPVMANWHFGKKRNWYLHFGPYAGVLLSGKETTSQKDLKEITAAVDAGIALGIGVKIPIAEKVKIIFEFDGQAGLTDAFKQNDGLNVKNSRSSLSTGLVFDL
ncbi:porin family protein [Pedobacter sp. ASV1-7]|uniref:porin family protein n=1 Tax=Pedobacter sp. ASV1-7 TaxID=3145237 RepID=UPI0032E8C396